MSAYSDLDLDTPRAVAKRKARDLKAGMSHLADDARAGLEIAREKGLDLANASSARAAAYARSAADHARAKPISTGLIVAAIGIGLVFLLSRSARSTVVGAGEELWSRYGRH